MTFKAVLLDLDGVICSTDRYHYLAWKQVADELGIPFGPEANDRLRGVSRMESLEIILERYVGPELSESEKLELAERKNRIYRRYLERMTRSELSGEVWDTLRALRARGLKLAIGSSSRNTPLILERIGLAGWFDAVSDGNSAARSKPDPEVFLNAAALLQEAPEDCLVVEDAVSGAAAGHAGGMKVACLGNAATAGAGDYNLKSFRELLELV